MIEVIAEINGIPVAWLNTETFEIDQLTSLQKYNICRLSEQNTQAINEASGDRRENND